MINTVIIEGNLTRDVETIYTPSGTPICNLCIAHNSYKKNGEGKWEQQEASFFNVTAFGYLAEKVAAFTKGGGVVVAGRLKQERWEDKNDGKPRSKVSIIANAIRPIHKVEKQTEESEDDIPL